MSANRTSVSDASGRDAVEVVQITADASRSRRTVSPRLVGLFLEDLNFGLDGGLNANLVNNHSFEAVYLDRRLHSFGIALLTRRRPRRRPDRARHWHVDGGALTVVAQEEPGRSAHFGRVLVQGRTVVTNHGYPGDEPSMGARSSIPLRFEAQMRLSGFAGTLHVALETADGGTVATSAIVLAETDVWQTVSTEMVPSVTAPVALRLVFLGAGAVDLDEVSLIPTDHWGAGDPLWTQGRFRRDLVEAIRDMHPRFLRFPGGCVVEGLGDGNEYDWKKTVGPIPERRGDYNLWGLNQTGGDYYQSQQIGFHEFFQLCEDLAIEPIPVVSAGVACQIRARETVPIGSAEFDALVANAVDLIDWATGDPAQNRWAAMRAAAGHPRPFRLDTIAIGNENHGPDYEARFAIIRDAVQARRPDITVILSAGAAPGGRRFDAAWRLASMDPDPGTLVVDEHFYSSPEWFRGATRRYDDYDRAGPKVFVGEYAAHIPTILTPAPLRSAANSYESALAEAAFLTGLVRNSDVVTMASYAPLLNRVGSSHWEHDLIDFNAFAVQPSVNHLVQGLFSTSLGDTIVEVEGALPAELHVSSSRTRRTQFIQLVNTGTDPQPIEVHLGSDARATGSARLREVVADPSTRNELGLTGSGRTNVRPRERTAALTGGALRLELAPSSIVIVEIAIQGG